MQIIGLEFATSVYLLLIQRALSPFAASHNTLSHQLWLLSILIDMEMELIPIYIYTAQ